MLKVIFATTNHNDFCTNDRMSLPWGKLKEDLQYFKRITIGNGNNAVIMGKNTFTSLCHTPLPNRLNIVVSKSMYNNVFSHTTEKKYLLASNLNNAINLAKEKNVDNIFIIGGIQLLNEAFERDDIDTIYLNVIRFKKNETNNSEKLDCIKYYYKFPSYILHCTLEDIFNSNEYDICFYKYFNDTYININENDDITLTMEDVLGISKTDKYRQMQDLSNSFKVSSAKVNKNNNLIKLRDNLIKSRDKLINCVDDIYLNLVKKVLTQGNKRSDRTNVGTLSLFGESFKIDISKCFPLLTCKRVYWKGVVEELLFFISGETDTKILEDKKVTIWKGNTSREFLDKRGLTHFKEGEYGECYGYNWRHFGKEYTPILQRDEKYVKEGGVDQLQNVIDMIKKDPTSRRHYVTAWNPCSIDRIPLPSCHINFQFYVNGDELSILVNMRSCDVFLGLPFNIASYALLTYMIAHLTNLKPKELTFMLGDTHIYNNHISQCEELLTRSLKNSPTLLFNRKVNNIDEFTFNDFTVENYDPHPTIKGEMAI